MEFRQRICGFQHNYLSHTVVLEVVDPKLPVENHRVYYDYRHRLIKWSLNERFKGSASLEPLSGTIPSIKPLRVFDFHSYWSGLKLLNSQNPD
ncbi:hypothetical protein ACTXT7_011419 [Hymenolepis weldensis]